MNPIPAWARYLARQPDGTLYAFEARPEIEEIPGVYPGQGGEWIVGPPCPAWEPPDDTMFQAVDLRGGRDWRYGDTKPGELLPDEWPGWRESLEAI